MNSIRNPKQADSDFIEPDFIKSDLIRLGFIERWAPRYFVFAAFAYVILGVIAMLVLSPRVPYADAWQHYARLLSQPFPASVIAAENGHPELFANLLRLASLRWFGGDELLQILIGLLLALGCLAVLLLPLKRRYAVAPATRAAIALVLALGIFWLGNARALLHDNESLHVYSVLLCLAGAIVLLQVGRDQQPTYFRVLCASILCVLAALNFGSGSAAFVAVFSLLFVQRARLSSWLVVTVSLLFTLGIYALLKGSSGVPLSLHPLDQSMLTLRTLASPLIYLFWPLLDPIAAAALPHALTPIGDIANAWTSIFGEVRRSVFPQVIFGAAFVLVLIWSTWRARRYPASFHAVGQLGFALAWFGLAVAGLIALTRFGYFVEFPEQVYAPRYLPWSTLAWAGLLIIMLSRRGAGKIVLVVAALVSIFALAAEVGMTITMIHAREIADDTALAAVVGIWPDRDRSGETDTQVTQQASVLLRARHLGPFAWPQAQWIGQAVPDDARPVAVTTLEFSEPHNDINHDGVRIDATLAPPACRANRLVVVDQGRVVGLLRPLTTNHWRGAANVHPGDAGFTVVAVCDESASP
jgi:hypothetical protein